MDAIQLLSVTDRNLFLFSLPSINKNMDFFVIRFYNYFLQTKTKVLFENTNINKQHKMFGSTLNIILSYITDPTLLEDQINKIISTHVQYGVISDNVDDFIDSFMKALNETLPETSNKKIFIIWNNVITEIMMHFRQNL